MQYLEPLELYKEKPYLINIPAEALPPGLATNESYIPYPGIVIEDMRGKENNFTLDRNGFAVFRDDRQHESVFKSSAIRERLGVNFLGSCLKYDEYDDYAVVKTKYRKASEDFLTHLLGAETTKTFTHEVRRRQQSFPKKPRGDDGSPQPIQGVHVDFTRDWALRRMQMVYGSEFVSWAEQRRWQVMHTWRPLKGPLFDWPLAVCDYQSVNPRSDFEAGDNIYPHLQSESFLIYYSAHHRWHYLSEMQPGEILVFKSYDSHGSGDVAICCPHCAFDNELAPSSAAPRESVETVSFVVYPD
ncbi:hypothetical protein AYL99_09075 [Fonsecaea erecta]|uniref:Uncharacterized protein n=1 Tax=Fonsecaea erecta TaxID=1367422 RepID=A0A178ZCQ3_9EURO|nr:hypothetical protein AYL99_09075 [Fonsecaea erecta]OAP56963.1 hypothetical protein AYL99_09075 [Fonsecaea erecta]